MTPKIARFLAERNPPTPCLVVDLDVIAHNYKRLKRALPLAELYYAVKANPAAEVLRLLDQLGSRFDTASIYEIEDALALGISPAKLSFGNTIKKEADIARAFAHGVRLYAFDSQAELEKLARAAPGARVFCRIYMTGEGADWPLSRKFGCSVEMARVLMIAARHAGLAPHGVWFHVGSQQRDLTQ